MPGKIKVAAGVVLYNPDESVWFNISTYSPYIDKLVIVDNSEVRKEHIQAKLAELFPKAEYVHLNGNMGIAVALNKACEMAINHNCEWILTMDQDSNFKEGQLSSLISGIPTVTSMFPNIGILTPHHALHAHDTPAGDGQYTSKTIAMTSGNLLNLVAFKATGPFDEKLFMDYVDYEYCLRLQKNGYKIIQDNHVHLNHSLGNFRIRKVLGQNIGVSNHNALRRYYMTRNSLHVAFKYPKQNARFFFRSLWNVGFGAISVILLFEENKAAKLKSIYKGVLHFLRNKYGKYEA